jgi:hypothetical protein
MFYIHFLKHLDYGRVTLKRIVQTSCTSLGDSATFIKLSQEQLPAPEITAASITSPVLFYQKEFKN